MGHPDNGNLPLRQEGKTLLEHCVRRVELHQVWAPVLKPIFDCGAYSFSSSPPPTPSYPPPPGPLTPEERKVNPIDPTLSVIVGSKVGGGVISPLSAQSSISTPPPGKKAKNTAKKACPPPAVIGR